MIATRTATVRVDGVDQEFQANFDEPILDSALRAGVKLPHQCRGASCGTCKCEVVSGEVEHGWSLGFAISDEEKAAGRCLACQAMPRSPTLTIRPLLPMPSLGPPVVDLDTTILASFAETPRVRRLVVAAPIDHEFVYQPGMYAELRLPGISPDRRYSFVEPNRGDGLLTFWVALHPGGQASSVVHQALSVGDRVGIRGPFGTCRLPDGDGPVVALAGGTGLAPVVAILADALNSGLKAPVSVLCSVRDRHELLGLPRLERLARLYSNFSFDYTVTDVAADAASQATKSDSAPGIARYRLPIPALLPTRYSSLNDCRLLISGSPGFVDATIAAALALGASPQAISSDRFAPVSTPR